MNNPPDIARLHIPATPVGKSSSSFRDAKLVFSEDGRRASIVPSFGSHLAGLFMAAFGGGFVALALYAIPDDAGLAFRLPFGLIGGLFCLIGILGGLGFLSRHSTVDRRDGLVKIGRLRRATIPLADCRAIQLCPNPGKHMSYEMNLVLQTGRRVCLMSHGDLPSVSEDAHRLADFLRLPLVDHARPAGEVLKTAMHTDGAGNFRTRRVTFDGPDRATVAPSIEARVFFAIFVAAGLAVSIFLSPFVIRDTMHRWPEMLFGLIPISIGIVFTLLGFAGMTGRLSGPQVVFDRRRGDFRRLKGKREIARPAPLSEVEALQICSYINPGDSDTRPYAVWELNLVLKSFDRVNLMAYGDRAAIFSDAQKLAGFLDRPLLDHSDPDHADMKKVRNWPKKR